MYKHILAPIDGSLASRRGLEEAVKLARNPGASLRLIHIVNEFIMDAAYAPVLHHDRLIDALREGGRQILQEAEAAAKALGVNAQTTLVEVIGGCAADVIIEQARSWPADVIVMGTHGRRGLRRVVMGSDAEQVLRLSQTPVLMVRAQEEAD